MCFIDYLDESYKNTNVLCVWTGDNINDILDIPCCPNKLVLYFSLSEFAENH